MCATILQIVYIAGLVVGGGLTITALVTNAWTAGASGSWDNSGLLIKDCIQDSSKCQNSFQNLEGYQKAAAILLILAIIILAVALIWALFTCCACCCHACLFPLFPVFAGIACGLVVVAVIVYGVNIQGLTTSNIGWSMWCAIGAALVLAVDTIVSVFLCECCSCCV